MMVIPLANMSSTAQSWYSLGPGLNDLVYCIEPHGADAPGLYDIYAGGKFTNAGGNDDADYIAWWDGINWHAVAPGLNDEVYAIAFADGKVYAGGAFTDAGGNPNADYIAYWDGIQWNALGDGLNGFVNTIAIDGNQVYVGGKFDSDEGYTDHIALWDGEKWNSLGNGLNYDVNVITIHDQVVYAGGWFVNAGGDQNADFIARWDGQNWNAIGTGLDGAVITIEINDNGIYAGGIFSQLVARWHNGEWKSLGNGPNTFLGEVIDIAISGHILYAAAYQDGVLKWDGDEWVNLINWPFLEPAWTIAIQDKKVYVGGEFFLGPGGTFNIAELKDEDLIGTKVSPEINAPQLKIYPNPTTDQLSYTLGDIKMAPHQIELTDVTGQVMLSMIQVENELNLAHLPAGLYFLKIQFEEGMGMAKVLKQ